ncbi:hypothetical protein CBL_08446 [Carabus blaptoides fortunei]
MVRERTGILGVPEKRVVGWLCLRRERPRVAFWGCSLLCGPQNKFKYEYLAWYWQMGKRIWFNSTLLVKYVCVTSECSHGWCILSEVRVPSYQDYGNQGLEYTVWDPEVPLS